MAKRRLCVEEVTTVNFSENQTVTCCPDPLPGTIVGLGDECNVKFSGEPELNNNLSQLSFTIQYNPEFVYETDGTTAIGRCVVKQEETISVPGDGTTPCCTEEPSIISTITCETTTHTETCVSSSIPKSFTITYLCVPTVICVEDTTCEEPV